MRGIQLQNFQLELVFNTSKQVYFCFFSCHSLINKQTDRLMVSEYRRPWIPAAHIYHRSHNCVRIIHYNLHIFSLLIEKCTVILLAIQSISLPLEFFKTIERRKNVILLCSHITYYYLPVPRSVARVEFDIFTTPPFPQE